MATPAPNATIINNINPLDLASRFGALLPQFNGDCKKLNSFIKNCNDYLTQFSAGDQIVKAYCFAVIKSKLVGKADDELHSSNIPDTWDALKEFLIVKFGDRVNLDVLKNELQFLHKFPNENIFMFIDRIKAYKIRINYRIDSELTLDPNLKLLHKQLVEDLAKNVLMGNVPIDLQTSMLTAPNLNFDSAVQIVENYTIRKEQLDMIRNQYKPQSSNPKSQSCHNIPSRHTNIGLNNPSNFQYSQNKQFTKSPKPVNAFQPRNEIQHYQPTPMSIQSNRNNYQITPMSTQTHRNYPEKRPISSQTNYNPHNKFKSSHNFFQSSRHQPNFISEELTNIQNDETPEILDEFEPGIHEDFDDSENVDNFPQQDENFIPTASQQPLT